MAGCPTAARIRPLSAAVLAGCQIHPLTMAAGRIGGRQGRSALVAMWVSQFAEPRDPDEPDVTRGYTADGLALLFPELRDGTGMKLDVGCPAGPIDICPFPDFGATLEQKIIHLEARHGFSREHVAAWLRAYGY